MRIILDKSKWAPMSILAVLKAGAAFLLLESGLPFERLDVMVRKAACSHAVTSPGYSYLACSLVPNVVAVTGTVRVATVVTVVLNRLMWGSLGGVLTINCEN